MKKLFFFFLIINLISNQSYADDIKDFQIEGMSIGDSLLKYASKNEIEKYKKFAPTIVIHRRFSKNEVIEKLHFLLEMNLYVEYSYNPSKRIYYKKLIKKKLLEFSEKNPLFGRIIFTRNTRTSIFSNHVYNSPYDYTENVSSPTITRRYSFNNSSYSTIRNWLNFESDSNSIISNVTSINLDNDPNDDTISEPEPIVEEPDSDDTISEHQNE